MVKTSPVNGNGEFAGLEDASPQTYKAPEPDVVDLGRWSIKETIERARSSGMLPHPSLVQTCQAALTAQREREATLDLALRR